MSATQGPCAAWDPIWCCTLTGDAVAVTGTALQFATEILYLLSGQRFGPCEVTLRPCRRDCSDDWLVDRYAGPAGGSFWPYPALVAGQWLNLACGVCGDTCSCTGLSEAVLPGPVAAVIQVKLDGGVLVSGSDYRIDDFRKLVRLGGGTWPICQQMDLPDSEVGTWSVTYLVGETVPVAGRYAVGELACEIVKACTGQACVLPANATQVTRQGITIDFPTFTELLANGSLGLRWCDLFVGTYNPQRLVAAPLVYDVDGPAFRRTTWP